MVPSFCLLFLLASQHLHQVTLSFTEGNPHLPYVGEPSLSHLLSDLCFITPSNLMQVKRGALRHSLEVMSWTSHFPHGYGDEMTQWCFLLFMLSFSFYSFNKDDGDSESLPIRTCSFSHAIHFGLSTPSAR